MNTFDPAKFERILTEWQNPGGRVFSPAEANSLSLYYRLVAKWNPRLHLTTITEPHAFLTRHVLESLYAEEMILESVEQVWDIGSGSGVPGLMIAIVRPQSKIYLVESNRKKSVFLSEAATTLGLSNVQVIGESFQSLPPLEANACMMVRAIEEMTGLLPDLLTLGRNASQLLLFAGSNLEGHLLLHLPESWKFTKSLLPNSLQRFLFNAVRST